MAATTGTAARPADTERTSGSRLVTAGVCAVIVLGLTACGSSKTALSGPAIQGSTLTIYSSLPLQGATTGQAEGIVNGANLDLALTTAPRGLAGARKRPA